MASKKVAAPKFNNRTRPNWGYQDATLAVEQGWACRENNFGFAKGGLFACDCPEDVLAKHYDKQYAQGWIRGYRDALATGSRPNSSEPAWLEALTEGKVSV